MAVKIFGKVCWSEEIKTWVVMAIEPHAAIKLKAVFSKIPKVATPPYRIPTSDDTADDLEWFFTRYPFEISVEDRRRMTTDAAAYRQNREELEEILAAGYVPAEVKINGKLRDYQARAVDLFLKTKRLLVGDSVGLGKTLIGIGALTDARTRPTIVVVQAHLTRQWAEQVVRFLSLKPHILKKSTPYTLPPADVYITTYSKLSGWVDVFNKYPFKTVIFDEIQELRRPESNKYQAAKVLAGNAERCLGLSATPVYNYGDEIFNIVDLVKPGALGSQGDFLREWCGYSKKVSNPKALGTYLRERHLLLRRTREDVSMELPPVNRIVHTVGHDEEAMSKVEEVAHQLATRALTGSFTERGMAGRELDLLLRMTTGIGKASFVAEYVRIFLENDEPVLLAGWHRDVYDIWLKRLEEFNPVLYTGSESPAQKEAAKQAFVSGKSKLMIISLRSGVGLDGLQSACKTVVFGELDWSPAVHEQVIGRVDRDGQKDQVTAIYLVSDAGSDPLVVDMLGIKASQAAGIVDPLSSTPGKHSDDSRVKMLAESILKKRGVPTPRVEAPAMETML